MEKGRCNLTDDRDQRVAEDVGPRRQFVADPVAQRGLRHDAARHGETLGQDRGIGRVRQIAGIDGGGDEGIGRRQLDRTAAARVDQAGKHRKAVRRRRAELLAGEQVDYEEMNEYKAKLKRSEEHTSELQSLMRIPYAVFCLKKKKN